VFNIGPMELMVLIVVGLIVLGPDRLPGLARDAARMLRTLREMATGARTQLRDELGPEFADLDLQDLRRLNPRSALQRAILGDEDLRDLDPRQTLRKTFSMDDDQPVSMSKSTPPAGTEAPAQQPLGRDEHAPFDSDAT
jgi:sec-independent protein translocase protein TatB